MAEAAFEPETVTEEITGPFGPARKVDEMRVAEIVSAYRQKCGADVSPAFSGLESIVLYECAGTGHRFWRPERIAADESMYRVLAAAWRSYYRADRWEYAHAKRRLRGMDTVLEVGCGRGYFLRALESTVKSATGLELNREAIAARVTKMPIELKTVETFAAEQPRAFDAVCSFQVLEHLIDPAGFLHASLACLKPGGLLILSTPNADSAALKNREDAFDLPPHHVGHFSERTFRSLAARLDLDVVDVLVEPRRASAADTVSAKTRSHPLYRQVKSLASGALTAVYSILKEPGNNILVVFRKRG